jgi:hypothetical protein
MLVTSAKLNIHAYTEFVLGKKYAQKYSGTAINRVSCSSVGL